MWGMTKRDLVTRVLIPGLLPWVLLALAVVGTLFFLLGRWTS